MPFPLINPDTCLQAITAADFTTIAHLANTIWSEHYTPIIGKAQVDYMLADRYTPEKLQRYLDANDRWMLLLSVDDEPAGYCSYALTDIPEEMKVEQLYVLSGLRGKNLGTTMLTHIEQQARLHSRNKLVLQVNKKNGTAIAFYRRMSFTVREAAVFDIGDGYVMDDYVMEKLLTPVAA